MARDFSKASGEGKFKARPEEIAKRSSRNAARAIMKAEMGAAKIKGKEVEHKDGNPRNNSRSNLKLVTPAANNNGRRGGPAKMKGKC